jgi:hypothetical protein
MDGPDIQGNGPGSLYKQLKALKGTISAHVTAAVRRYL